VGASNWIGTLIDNIAESLSNANQALLHDISVSTPTDVPVWQQAVITVEKAVVWVINEPTMLIIGRPLIGNGADGTAAHPDGYAGGLLDGNGGNGVNGGNGGNAGLLGGNGGDGADGTADHPNGGNGGDVSGPGRAGNGGNGYNNFYGPGGNGGNGGNVTDIFDIRRVGGDGGNGGSSQFGPGGNGGNGGEGGYGGDGGDGGSSTSSYGGNGGNGGRSRFAQAFLYDGRIIVKTAQGDFIERTTATGGDGGAVLTNTQPRTWIAGSPGSFAFPGGGAGGKGALNPF
jgi:hypothetical protein